MRTPACIATYGGLLALWTIAGAEWVLAAVGLGTGYQFDHRLRYGRFVDFED